MGRIIAVANQKGGVGKTTTAINLSACLAEKGKHILVIDLDPQGNTSSGFGIEKNELKYTLYHLMIGTARFSECVVENVVPNLDILPSNVNLSGVEIETIGMFEREYILFNQIDKIRHLYDFIIVDCPPSLNTLTVNGMTTADTILVPIQCEYYALEGLSQLTKTIKRVKKSLNKDLSIEGVLLTMFDSRTNLSVQVVEEVKKYFSSTVFNTVIPRNVRLSEAPSYGMPVIAYDKNSKGAECYKKLAAEVIKKNKK